jgi:thiamine kinase-like enzyme
MGQGLDRAITELGGVPRTLVHGDSLCHNIMVQDGSRIRPLDWEWAAIGVPAWDVVRLLDGWGDERDRFLTAYADAMSKQATIATDSRALENSLAHCRVMLKLWRIRWWAKACQEPGGVNRILNSIETI